MKENSHRESNAFFIAWRVGARLMASVALFSLALAFGSVYDSGTFRSAPAQTSAGDLPFAEGKEGTSRTVTINGVEAVFRWRPPGEFTMGSPENEEYRDDDETSHKVVITNGFWLAEIANGQAVKKIEEFRAQSERELSPPKIEPKVDEPGEQIQPISDENRRKNFRERASVREPLADVGLIDWSERNWRSRRGGGNGECPNEQEEEEEPDYSDNRDNESDSSSRLLARLTNNIVNRVGDQIKASIAESLDTATDKVGEVIEQRAKEKYEQVEPTIKRVARALLFKGCLLFVVLSIFSLLIVGTVKRALSWCKRKVIAWLASLKIPEENNPS